MKKIQLVLCLILTSTMVKAQWTNNGSNLTTTDNVGIGTTSPSMRLHVAGSIASGPNNIMALDHNKWFNFGNVSGYGTINWFSQVNNDRTDFVNTHASVKATSIRVGNGNILFLTSAANNGIGQSSGLATRMSIASNGDVGIGTTNPSFALHVNSPDNQLMRFTSTNGTWLDFESTNAPSGSRIWSIGHLGLTGQFGVYQRDGANQYRLMIGQNGNVGIGTNSTGSHKLAVEGSIGARKVKVEASGWSDFVFQNDYELRSLQEVEQYITQNKHLPEIPNSAEVQRDGIDLGEMDSKLLQKIEELTLYLIEQNKQNQAQQERIEKLEKELKALKGK